MSDTSLSENWQDHLQPLAMRLSYASLLVFVVLSIGMLVFLLSLPGWELMGVFILSCTIAASSLLALLLSRSARTKLSLLFLGGSGIFLAFVLPLLLQGSSTLIMIPALIIVGLSTSKLPSQKIFIRVLTYCGSIFIVGYLVDQFGVQNRPRIFGIFVENTVLVLLFLVMAVVLLRRFSVSSIRYKVVVSFLILTLFLVFVVGLFSINAARSALIDAGIGSLQVAANHTADILDDFFLTNLMIVETESSLEDLVSEFQIYRDNLTARKTNFVNILKLLTDGKEKATRTDSSFLFFKGYILADQKGEIITCYPSEVACRKTINSEITHQVSSTEGAFISPVFFNQNQDPELFFASPIFNANHDLAGILLLVYDGRVVQQLVQKNNNIVGDRSLAWVIDENDMLLAQGTSSEYLYQLVIFSNDTQLKRLQETERIPFDSNEIIGDRYTGLQAGLTNLTSEQINYFYFDENLNFTGHNVRFIASSNKMTYQPWRVIYTQQESYFLTRVVDLTRNIRFLMVVLAIVIIIVALGFSRLITDPIKALTNTANQVADGNYNNYAIVNAKDEVGILASKFNSMVDQVNQTIRQMEERVKQRTFELERRSRQLQLAADVGRAAATIHDLNDLLERVTVLISERFNHYHVGIFLVDEAGEYVVLKAANSEGGKRMLSNGYRLVIGHQGIVGFVAGTGQPKIMRDTEEDIEYPRNSDLPHTRSTLTLPLISAGDLLGVLDVQSMKPNAFSKDDLSVMHVLADLIAVAIENARLFEEGQYSLEATRRAYGEISKQAWRERLAGKSEIAYRSQRRSTFKLQEIDSQHKMTSMSPQQISIPIKVRDSVVGYVDTYKSLDKGFWTEEEQETLNAIVEQIGIALESARLYESSLMQAERERLVGDINTRFQQSLDVTDVVKTAAREIRQALDLENIRIMFDDDFAGSMDILEVDLYE